MKRLYDYAKIIRSKNAGPLYITFDLIFNKGEELEYVKSKLTLKMISNAYGIKEDSVKIISYPKVNSLKITFPRTSVSGSINDNDIYGCQQHMPLSDILI